jgi:hypothetical protein
MSFDLDQVLMRLINLLLNPKKIYNFKIYQLKHYISLNAKSCKEKIT